MLLVHIPFERLTTTGRVINSLHSCFEINRVKLSVGTGDRYLCQRVESNLRLDWVLTGGVFRRVCWRAGCEVAPPKILRLL